MRYAARLASLLNLLPHQPRHLEAILIAAPRKTNHHHILMAPFRRDAHGLDDGMRRLQRRQDAFELAAQRERLERILVADVRVLDALGVLPVAVFGADAGVIEAGGNAVDVRGLAVLVLQD